MKHAYLAALIGIWSVGMPLACSGEGAQNSFELLHSCRMSIRIMDGDLPDKTEDYLKATWCAGYMAGIQNMNVAYGSEIERKFFCVPEAGGTEQMTRVVVKYLENHPEELHYPAILSVLGALVPAFPCH
jgi:hypothetical protein